MESTTGDGLTGTSDRGTGVFGHTVSGFGVRGYSSGNGVGVDADSVNNIAVRGYSMRGDGVVGSSTYGGVGVKGYSSFNDAVVGLSYSDAHAGVVGGHTGSGNGIYGESAYGYAGYFAGDVGVNGTLSKAAGSFIIDHPLDPANKTLAHSFVESPDMMNIYTGTTLTNVHGDATITLPAYFQALNREFRYQLTVIEQFAQAMVASEIAENRFTIKTDKPHVKVSWMVTGVRQDAYANAHRIVVEDEKPTHERGAYLYPEVYGQLKKTRVYQARPVGELQPMTAEAAPHQSAVQP